MGMDTWRLVIGGERTPGATGEWFESFDPATERPVARVALGTTEDVDRAVAAARAAVDGPWREVEPRRRARLLDDLARAIEAGAERLARLETLDTGKPIQRSRREVLSTARYFHYYAGAADKLNGESIPLGPSVVDFTVREPMGVTAHIAPWNAPLNMVGRSVAPALAAGNSAVVKPSMETPVGALELGAMIERLGFPGGVYNVVTGPGAVVGAHLAAHPGIDSLTFTGSVETGRAVMRAAAEHVKPVVLELGGKSPSIVFADADLDLAAAETIKGITANSGQYCNASSRLLVQAEARDALLDRVLALTARLRVGPGIDGPDMGPLISRTQRERVLGYIDVGRQEGAEVLAGGGPPPDRPSGWFVQPTVLDRVEPSATVAQEEIFGPVLSVLTFADDSEALAIANSVRYGLAAGIFTRDIDRALGLAMRIKAGQIYVNEYFAGGEETPFGGYKLSGFGREKGLAALANYTQIKNVAIRLR